MEKFMATAIKLFLFALVTCAVGIGGVNFAYDVMEKEQASGCSGTS